MVKSAISLSDTIHGVNNIQTVWLREQSYKEHLFQSKEKIRAIMGDENETKDNIGGTGKIIFFNFEEQ